MAIPKQAFGRTGHVSSRIIFGAAALSVAPQDEADRVLDLLLEYDINHIDVAASYGDAELRVGPWMADHREHFFLATKTDKRTYAAAKDEFARSLDRLRVDSVDLIQLHCLIDADEWNVAMGPGGALEYLIEARDQGLARFIGVTGHGVEVVDMHQRSLERFDFDSVLLPYNYPMVQNLAYAAGFDALVHICQQRDVAVQTIKSVCRRPYPTDERLYNTWYEPLTEQASVDKAVHWVLGRDEVFLNTAADTGVLPKVLDAANRFEARPTDAEMQSVVEAWDMEPLFT
jgi:aryl-alcohol dehydrogenase-like predicted oxidoreductase